MSTWNQNIAPRDCGSVSAPAFGNLALDGSAGMAGHTDAGVTTRERGIAAARPQNEAGTDRTFTSGTRAWSPPT